MTAGTTLISMRMWRLNENAFFPPPKVKSHFFLISQWPFYFGMFCFPFYKITGSTMTYRYPVWCYFNNTARAWSTKKDIFKNKLFIEAQGSMVRLEKKMSVTFYGQCAWPFGIPSVRNQQCPCQPNTNIKSSWCTFFMQISAWKVAVVGWRFRK